MYRKFPKTRSDELSALLAKRLQAMKNRSRSHNKEARGFAPKNPSWRYAWDVEYYDKAIAEQIANESKSS
jgi:hypothetical protein